MRLNTVVGFAVAALALAAVLFLACSSSRDCRPGTLKLSIQLRGTVNFADTVTITSEDPSLDVSTVATHTPDGNNLLDVDVTFPHGYPAGQVVHMLARATGGSTLLGEDLAVVHLDDTCSTAVLTISGTTLDEGVFSSD